MKKVFRKILKPIVIVLTTGVFASSGFGETVSVYFSQEVPQHEFAANDIKSALEAGSYTVEFKDLSALTDAYQGKKVVIALASDTGITSLLISQGGGVVADPGEQGYALRTTSAPEMSYWVFGGDATGAMYGGLQIAENINFNGYTGSYNEEESPHLKYRGIKFNIPLDEKAPTYFNDSRGTANMLAIRHVWDSTFWQTWFDEMARHRYNVLSLWIPHPFTAMLNMEDEYPGIAIQGVTGFDENENQVQINNWTIDEKIAFWQRVMKYGRDRGFGIYFCTWNIFLSTADGKHGLSNSPGDQETKIYLRKCMRKFLETYPDLSGFGITAGENMGDISVSEKEAWAWDSYGMGMKEYAEANPDRDLVFIHRLLQSQLDQTIHYFQPLIDLPNVRFDLSYKYSLAHAHAAVKPVYWDHQNLEEQLSANNLFSWLTVRNDDFFFLHWADPEYVRDYINNFPEVGKYVNAFYIGSDGWVFTREFASKDPYYKDMNALSIQKTWYMQKLWGRIGYNPSVSDELFKNHLAYKYPEASSEDLFEAWSKASRAIRLANEQVTGEWNLDFKWWPEGWTCKLDNNDVPSLSEDGFLRLEHLILTDPQDGSNLCSLLETAKGSCNGTSAFANADEIEQLAIEALAILEGIGSASDKELELNLQDLKAMAYLGLHDAWKFRAAMFKQQGKISEARDAMGSAYCNWIKYTGIMDALYSGVRMQRNHHFNNWHDHDADVLKDYTDLGGTDNLNCANPYPWVAIVSPADNVYFLEPADITVDINADAGPNLIEKVELKSNGILIGTDSESPYAFSLNGMLLGNYTLVAIAYDDQGSIQYDTCNFVIYDSATFNRVPWMEEFTHPDGTRSDDGPTSWTSSRSSGNLYVMRNMFAVNDAGTQGVLKTAEMDISKCPVEISLELYSTGKLESDDYVKLYKIVDNGPEILIGEKTGNQDNLTRISGVAEGNTLSLVIRTRVSFNSEYYYMDNLSVTYANGCENQAPVISITAPAEGTEYTEPAHVTFVVEASDPDGSIDRVELRNNGTPEQIKGDPPYNFSLTNLSAGSYTFAASAFDNYGASSNSFVNLLIHPNGKLNQTITFPVLPVLRSGDPDFDPGATASSGFAVTYTSSNETVATIDNGMIHAVGAGTSIITASQEGDANYNPAPDISRTLTVIGTVFIDLSDFEVKIFPNPATNKVYISVPGEYSVSVFNMFGIEIMKNNHLTGVHDIDITNLERGVYIMKISGDIYCGIKKFILE